MFGLEMCNFANEILFVWSKCNEKIVRYAGFVTL